LGCLVTVSSSEGFGLNRMSPPTLPPAKWPLMPLHVLQSFIDVVSSKPVRLLAPTMVVPFLIDLRGIPADTVPRIPKKTSSSSHELCSTAE